MKTSTHRFKCWHLLPAEVLVFIFAFLPKKDFLKAREVCRQWRDVSLTSQFWARRTFVISGQNDEEILRISRYFAKFGTYLRHLTISAPQKFFFITLQSENAQRRLMAEVHEVLQSAGSELRSFHLRYISLHDVSFKIAKNWKEPILTALFDMLKRQKALSVLGFTNTCLMNEDGVELLRLLATLSNNTKLTGPATALKSLTLHGLFNFRITSMLPVPEILEALGRLETLENIEVNFGDLRSDVLASLTSGCPRLKRIVLYVDFVFDMQYLTPADWREQVQKNPELTVVLRVYHVSLKRLHPHLSPAIPLASLTLDMPYGTSNDSVRATMRSINLHCLTTFILKKREMDRPSPVVLVELVRACPSLTHLSLQMKVKLKTLQRLAAAAQTRTTSHVTPGTATLQIHIGGCNTALETEVLEGLRAINPFCTVHLCDGPVCEPVQHRPAFM